MPDGVAWEMLKFKWAHTSKIAALDAESLREEYKEPHYEVMVGRVFPPGLPQNMKVKR